MRLHLCIILLTILLLLALTTTPAPAQTASAYTSPLLRKTTDYSGDFWSSPALTGDWGGLRNDLAQHGIFLDAYLTQVGQNVISGGSDNGWKYGSRGNVTIGFDIEKMGGWPGGFFLLEGEGQFGENINRSTGNLISSNINALFPQPNETQFNIPSVTYFQFFSPQLGIILGKIDTITYGDRNNFAHGKGESQFLNTAFSYNPTLALTVPSSTLGVGIIFRPNPDLTITLGAIDSEGAADTTGCDTAFKRGTTYLIETRLTTHFSQLTGHHLFGATYSDRSFVDLTQPRDNFFLPDMPIQRAGNSWCFIYNFDQYLYQPDEKIDRGWGVFGRFGVSDGQANPIHFFASIGLGAKGLLPGRKYDQCGIGYYYFWAADVTAPILPGFRDSQGLEAYYEFALTRSIFLTPDIQVIRPSQDGLDVATIIGLRLTMKF